MDLNKALRLAIDTGDVHLGSKQSSRAVDSGKIGRASCRERV